MIYSNSQLPTPYIAISTRQKTMVAGSEYLIPHTVENTAISKVMTSTFGKKELNDFANCFDREIQKKLKKLQKRY